VRGIAIIAAVLACAPLGIGQTTTAGSSGAGSSATHKAPSKDASKSTGKASSASSKSGTAGKPAAVVSKPAAATSKQAAANPKQAAATSKQAVANSKQAAGTSKQTAGASKQAPRTSVSANQKAPPARVPSRVVPHYYAQQQPTPDRYREIQRALADRGYFQGPADGMWGTESVDALKRFQADQNLDVDGKIGALSLIALGLGPRRENAAKPAPLAAPSERTAEPVPVPPSEPAPGASTTTP